MPQALSSIGNLSTNASTGGGGGWMQKILPLLMMGGGFAGNQMQQSRYNNMQDLFTGGYKQLLGLSPEKLAAQVNSTTQPLSKALQQYVGNTVQGQVAERGLSTAPGIYQTVLAQALAPYAIEQQKMALQTVLGKYGMLGNFNLPGGLSRPPMTDMSGLFRMLMGSNNQQSDPSGLTATQFAGLIDPQRDMGNGTMQIPGSDQPLQ